MKYDKLSLKEKVLSGMLVLILRDFGLKVISIVGQIILVRLVAPEYFGVFAILSFILYIFELISDLGFSQAIVQTKNELTNTQLSTVFYIKVILACLAILLAIVCFPLINLFYKQLNSSNFIMVIILSSTIIFKSIRHMIFALFDRGLKFNVISKIEVMGIVAYFIVAISLAYHKIFLWNFIWAIVVKEILELIVAFYYSRWRPSLKFNFRSIEHMVKYGSFLQIGNLIAFVENSMIPIAGSRLSSNNIGLLDWSASVARLSNTVFENYGRAAFAGMSKIQDRKDKISQAVNKSISFLNMFSFLFTLLVAGYSHEFTQLALSQKWIGALPSLYWFVSSVLFFGASITIAHALLAMGKSKEVTLLSGVIVIGQLVTSFFLTYYFGFVGIAIASFIAYTVQAIGYYIVGKKFGLKLGLQHIFFDKIIVFIIAGIIVILLNQALSYPSYISLTVKILVTILFYGILHFIISKEEISEALQIARKLTYT